MTVRLGRNYRDSFGELIELKARAAAPGRTAARRNRGRRGGAPRGRAANRAKTQFFAAASHDLRQPLHALGLFAEALRQKSRDDEATQLVNSINGSVDALDGLFSELLDITKHRHRRRRAAAAPTSSSTRCFASCGCTSSRSRSRRACCCACAAATAHAYADPLLVERIVRNLTANAIRYTNDGGVLVCARSARRQAAAAGVGHRRGHPRGRSRARVRRVRAGARRRCVAAVPHQRKGLGLGLSIVRAAVGADECAADAALATRPRHGVHARGAAGPRAAALRLRRCARVHRWA